MMRDGSFKALQEHPRGIENYQSTSSTLSQMKSSCHSQRLEEIRKKYDTPTRKQLKEIQVRPSYNNGSKQFMNSCKHSLVEDRTKGAKWDPHQSKRNVSKEQSPYLKQNCKNDEEAVFKKIKEMKESLLCGKGTFDKSKVTRSIYEPSRDHQLAGADLNDHRIQNIDKINSKIQQILSCLKENEGKGPTYDKEQSYNRRSRPDSFSNNSKREEFSNLSNNSRREDFINSSRRDDFSNNSYLNSIQKRSQVYEEQKSNSIKPHVSGIKNSSSIYQQEKNKKSLDSPARNTVEGFTLEHKRESSRARSFISSIQKDNGKYEMSNGKKLDDEISKIQNKIQQFEEEKKKLNIQFTPFSYVNSRSSADLSKRSYTVDKAKPQVRKSFYQYPTDKKIDEKISSLNNKRQDYRKVLERERSSSVLNIIPKKQTVNKDIEKSLNNVQIPQSSDRNSELTQSKNGFQIKLIPVEDENKSKRDEANRFKNEELRKKTDEGIENRKKILNYESKKSDGTTKRMINAFKNQTESDEQFRNNKLWFESSLGKEKWDKLAKKLTQNNIQMNQQQMKSVFMITDQQNNPFFSVRENGSDLDKLIKSYKSTQKNWNEQILHKFSREELEKDGFKEEKLDLERKGYLVVEDLVRFLNMETGNFYRNRDLYLILQRITAKCPEKQKMKFGDLMNTLCRK